MIEVKSLIAGITFKILHESGHETGDDELQEICSWPPDTSPAAKAEFRKLADAQPIVERKVFPLIHEIDLRSLPAEYRFVSTELPNDFAFVAGDSYSVFVIGQELFDEVVIAGRAP